MLNRQKKDFFIVYKASYTVGTPQNCTEANCLNMSSLFRSSPWTASCRKALKWFACRQKRTHSIEHRHDQHPAWHRNKANLPTHHWKEVVPSLWCLESWQCIDLQRNLVCMAGLPCSLLHSVMGGGGEGGQQCLINQPSRMHAVASETPQFAFRGPLCCTKASVVFITGAAIRIMRPKGLSIKQKAWLGKNKPHLCQSLGQSTEGQSRHSDQHSAPNKHFSLWSSGTTD